MRKFTGVIKTHKLGSECDFAFEVSDSATNKEIEQEAREAAFDNVEWYYEEEDRPQ